MKSCVVIWMAFVLMLSACVPIPQNPPATPVRESGARVSDLASAFTKMFGLESTDEVLDRLSKLEECVLDEMTVDQEVTPREQDALVLYLIGLVHTATMVARLEDVEDGRLDGLYDPDTDDQGEQMLQQFDWAVSYCREGD